VKDLLLVEQHLSGDELRTLQLLLRQSPDPDSAFHYLGRFIVELGGEDERLAENERRAEQNGGQQDSEDPRGTAVASLFRSKSRLVALLTVFSHSHALTETLFRYPQLLDWALDSDKLYRVLSAEELRADLGWLSPERDHASTAHSLSRFKKMHLLRIALRDLLGLATLAEVTLELSSLADAILQGAQEYLHQQLIRRFGMPLTGADEEPIESQFVILAMGKLGGRELNYSSDIDLIFLYTGDGKTSGPVKIPVRELFTQTAQHLTKLLSQMTPEGACYRVDLRLRPEGSSGEVAPPLSAVVRYYHQRARDWELQALIKARAVAGDRALGERFLRIIEPLIYQTSTDFSTIERLSETRDRIHRKLSLRRGAGLDVKLSRGGIRDIEFLVQCMQRLYGGPDTWVRNGGTLFSLQRLRDKGYLSVQDHSRLQSAYTYLRVIEHRLQMDHDRQTHTIPPDEKSRQVLASKMGGADSFREGAFRERSVREHSFQESAPQERDALMSQVKGHFADVTEIYERVIGAQSPRTSVPVSPPRPPQASRRAGTPEPEHSWEAQLRHLEQRSPKLAAAVLATKIHHGRKHFEHFLNKFVSSPELLALFEGSPELIACVTDLFEHSPHLAEHLIRHPEDTVELKSVVEAGASRESDERREIGGGGDTAGRGDASSEGGFDGGGFEDYPAIDRFLDSPEPASDSRTALRRFYRRRMLRIQAESVYGRDPIFTTLTKTSRLTEWVIRAAFEIAIREIAGTSGSERPKNPMQIIALGRLGMGEFDIGSDADLVFVITDEGAAERAWWHDTAEGLIGIISSYTQEGVLFSIDTRLRPMGRDGALIQTESRYKKYFAEQAEPWEAMTYMKARTIAGDIERGTSFLSELQNVDWKRFGTSRDTAGKLMEMREKLERSQGPSHPIKAGPGGYYDIDFILMSLRLKDAVLFFSSLNTHARIEMIRVMGGLTPAQAGRLSRAAVIFRSLDHAIRLATGPSSHKLPSSPSQLEIVANLLGRWSPVTPAPARLSNTVDELRQNTRQLFSEIFGGLT
jgi:glutamate-ammonia-ligase adenylyltransferase